MAFDREAAKADGYTDEEIDQYLATKDQPLPPEAPRDRTEETIGTFTSAIPDAVKYAAEGAGLYAGGKALAGAIANRGTPTAPTTFTGGANPAFDAALSRPYTPPATAPTAPPTTQNYMSRMSQLASRYAPIMKGAGILGAGVALGQGLFGTSPEEVATLKAAEERRRQAAMNQIPR